MVDGMWIVQFMGLQGNGGGVVVLYNGKVLGGDSAYTYVGTYTMEDKNLKCLVRVSKFLEGFISVLGIEGDSDLQMEAAFNPQVMQGVMHVVGNPELQLAVKLTKISEL